ncbi:MAG: DnaA/Hda family protein, partial [Gallionella sp.]
SVPDCTTVVAVDDVEKLGEYAQIDLFNLYNQVRESGGMLLVSGKDAPQNLALRKDLTTRLGWGLVYQLHSLSDAEKAVALAQHGISKGYKLSEEVIQYLLRHGRRDLPSLMASLDELDAYSLSLHRAPSVPLLKQIMQTELELK